MQEVKRISDIAMLKGITMASYNIQGISSKIDDVGPLLSRSDLDFMCLQESFLGDHIQCNELEIDGYMLHRLDRDTNAITML